MTQEQEIDNTSVAAQTEREEGHEGDRFFIVYDWMVKELGLKGGELCLYALIYSFASRNELCKGSLTYLADRLGMSRQAISGLTKKLETDGLIERVKVVDNNVISLNYRLSRGVQKNCTGVKKIAQGVQENCTGGVQETLHSNKDYNKNNIINNIESDNTRAIINKKENYLERLTTNNMRIELVRKLYRIHDERDYYKHAEDFKAYTAINGEEFESENAMWRYFQNWLNLHIKGEDLHARKVEAIERKAGGMSYVQQQERMMLDYERSHQELVQRTGLQGLFYYNEDDKYREN